MKKHLALIFIAAMLAMTACNKEEISEPTTPSQTQTPVYTFDSSNSKLMFQDNESMDVMSSVDRQFEIAKVIRIRAINKDTIEIANFAPLNLSDITITLNMQGLPKTLLLLNIKKFGTHTIKRIAYPFLTGTHKCLDTDRKEVDMSAYKTTGIPTANVSFDFSSTSTLIKKLKKLSAFKWQIQFWDYNTQKDSSQNWKISPTPRDFRRFTGLFINMAYLFTNDSLKILFVKEPIIQNDGTTYMTSAEKAEVYQRFIDIPNFRSGIVTNVNGLGGGSTFGVAEYVLIQNVTTYPTNTVIHEMGHMLGYGHSSTMTYPQNNHGAVIPTAYIWSKLRAADDFPVSAANYYKQEDLK